MNLHKKRQNVICATAPGPTLMIPSLCLAPIIPAGLAIMASSPSRVFVPQEPGDANPTIGTDAESLQAPPKQRPQIVSTQVD